MFLNNANDSMAFLRGNDLRQLLMYIQSYILEYRDILKLPSNVTFGLELEYENLRQFDTNDFIDDYLDNWYSGSDGTVHSGGEVRSPILYDNPRTWRELQMICNFLRKNGAETKDAAGGHIHVGCNVLGSDMEAWWDFFRLYLAYEHVLCRFFYGDKLNQRRNLAEYAPPVADLMLQVVNYLESHSKPEFESLTEAYLSGKYHAINFENIDFGRLDRVADEGNTFEFRTPNATVNEVVEQNNVNVCTKLLVAAKRKDIAEDFLDYKIEHEFLPYRGHEYRYNEVCLKDALEFVDLVFDSNIDKIYFLKQYLKDFEDNYALTELTKAKVFYKV